MSHNINENRMFYVGEKPWHGLGKELANPATAKEAIEAAQLDYKVELQDIFTASLSKIYNRKATVRVDTKQALGVVGNVYKVVQNTEAFSFFDAVVGEGQAIYHTAGALGDGERIWILAKLPGEILVKNVDVIDKYLVLFNDHSGRFSLKVYFSPTRVVCQNTLNVSFANASQGISIRHTGNIKDKIEEARRVLGITIDYYKELGKIFEEFSNIEMNEKTLDKYYNDVVYQDIPERYKSSKKLSNKKDELVRLFEYGKGNSEKKIRHTLWAAYNAVTEYADHYRRPRGYEKDSSKRLQDAWFGSGALLKGKAYKEGVNLISKS